MSQSKIGFRDQIKDVLVDFQEIQLVHKSVL